MGRSWVWIFGAAVGIALSTSPAVAQTHVDIGVWTPNVGAQVVIGRPRVYVPAPVYAAPLYEPPVYVQPPVYVSPLYAPHRVYVPPAYVVRPRVYVGRNYGYPYYYRSGPIRGWEKHGGYYGYRPYTTRVYSRATVVRGGGWDHRGNWDRGGRGRGHHRGRH